MDSDHDESDDNDALQADASNPVSVVTGPPTADKEEPPGVPEPPPPSAPEPSPADGSPGVPEPPPPSAPEPLPTASRKRRKSQEAEGDPNFNVQTNIGTQNVDPTDNPDIAALEAKVAKLKAEYFTLEGAFEASEAAIKASEERAKRIEENALEQEEVGLQAQDELEDLQKAHEALTAERDRLIGVIERYQDLLSQEAVALEQEEARNEERIEELSTALQASYAETRRLQEREVEQQTTYLELLSKDNASKAQIKAAEEKLEQLQMLKIAEAQVAGDKENELNQIILQHEQTQAQNDVQAAAALEAHRVQVAQLQQQLDQSSAAMQAVKAQNNQLLATVDSSLANMQSQQSNVSIDAPQAGSSTALTQPSVDAPQAGSSTALTQPSVLRNQQIARQLKEQKKLAARVEVLTTQNDLLTAQLRDTEMRLLSSQSSTMTAEERGLLQQEVIDLQRQHADYVTETNGLLNRLREASRISLSHPQRWLHPQIVAAELQALEVLVDDREQALSTQAALLQTAQDQLASERLERAQEQANHAQIINNTRVALLEQNAEAERRRRLVAQVEANRQQREQAWADMEPAFRRVLTEVQFESNVTNQRVRVAQRSLTPEILQSIVTNGQDADQSQVLAALQALNEIVSVGHDGNDPTHIALHGNAGGLTRVISDTEYNSMVDILLRSATEETKNRFRKRRLARKVKKDLNYNVQVQKKRREEKD